LFWGCQKKSSVQRPAGDDFASLTGKGTPSWSFVKTKEDAEYLDFYSRMYELRKGLHAAMDGVYRIPPVVHFIWIGPRPFPRESVENVRTWLAHHPDWTFYFWTDRDRSPPCSGMKVRYIKDLTFLKLKPCFSTSDNYGEKSDLLRYEILFQEGGIYVDHDFVCFKPFDALNKAYDFYCGIDMPNTSSLSSCIHTTNSIIGAKAHHPILKECMDMLAERWDKIGEEYPGSDKDAMMSRIVHRTYHLFGEAVKQCHNSTGNRDIVFPAHYFHAPCDVLALFARHKYAGSWFQSESAFEKKVSERLMYLSKKSNKILLFVGVFSALNFLALLAVWFKVAKRKKC
jgi:hypothetical protein